MRRDDNGCRWASFAKHGQDRRDGCAQPCAKGIQPWRARHGGQAPDRGLPVGRRYI